MRGSELVLLLVAAALAGCVLEEAAPAAGPTARALPSGYSYACPAGAPAPEWDGPCAGTIASPEVSHQEPFVALDAARPDVIAVGVNAGHATGDADPAEREARPSALDVLVTEDGGASWRRSRLPSVELPPSRFPVRADTWGDPALAFDARGALHVSGMIGSNIFHVASPDLGRSWGAPTLLADDGDNDRNWLAVAPDGLVLVPWQNRGDSTEVAWSLDGGASWHRQAPEQREAGCVTASPIALHEGAALVACAVVADGRPTSLRVLAFDVASGNFSRLAELPVAAVWPHIVAAADGTLVLAAEMEPGVALAASRDGGRTWSAALEARDLVAVDDAWTRAEARWLAADPWGAVHLLLAGSPPPAGPDFFPSGPEVAHVALDPATWAILAEARLTAPDAAGPARAPPTLALAGADDYHGLAFAGGRGVMAWTREKAVEFTFVERAAGR